MKRKFEDWYARQIVTKMNKSTDFEKIDNQVRLSVMKHASWLMELYNYMTSSTEHDICMKRWEKIEICNAIVKRN